MPKMKSHTGASKRFKKTAGGIKRAKANHRHKLTLSKNRKQKNSLGEVVMVSKADYKKVALLLAC